MQNNGFIVVNVESFQKCCSIKVQTKNHIFCKKEEEWHLPYKVLRTSPHRSPLSSPSPPHLPGSCSGADRTPETNMSARKNTQVARNDLNCGQKGGAYMQPAAELPIVPHLDVDPLIEAEPDQVQWLLNSVGRWLLKKTRYSVRHSSDIHTHFISYSLRRNL